MTDDIAKSRSKNFTESKNKVLISACDKHHNVINKNSSRDVDKRAKIEAWVHIKRGFDRYCIIQGIHVANRTIEQLQNKYKSLKKEARKVSANVKRDIARTGNKALKPSTTKALQEDSHLLSLRARMGATATGFTSKHCSDASQTQTLKQLSTRRLTRATSTIVRPPSTEINAGQEPIDEQVETNYRPSKSIRSRKQRQFPGSVDSQKLIIGNPDTDTENDYTNENSRSSFHSWHTNQSDIDVESEGHMHMSQALSAIQLEQAHSQTTLQNPPPHGSNIGANIDDIDWNNYMDGGDEEFEIDRQLRLQREEEEEEAGTANVTGRLTAPANEIRRHPKRAPPANQHNICAMLRAKQIELVNEQIKLQKILVEEATERLEEAKERRQMVTAQRKSAEIDLRLKEREFN